MTESRNDARPTMPDYAPRYEVYREIGSGATAHVYLARDTRHDREVALKVLRPELTHAVGVERFLREIKVAAGLQHPNILAVFDSGETDEGVYYVMPYIDGVTLRERLQQGPIPLSEVIRIVSDVGDGLAYAHARGIIHRDVKPENIFLSGGHAYVGDFGIALAFVAAQQSPSRLTGIGLVVGTPTYMSPEQASGDEDIDGRSDEYSLACVLYEMLTQLPPFSSRTPLAERFVTPPPQLRRARPDLSRELEGALGRALSLEPKDRFATVDEFVAAVAAEGSGAYPKTTLVARLPWPVRVAAAVALIAVAAVVWRTLTAPPPVLNKSMIAVFPFIHSDSLPELHSDDCRMYLSRAIDDRWTDVTVVNEMELASASERYVGDKPSVEGFLRAARSLGAGFVASGTVTVLGDQVMFEALLYDVETGAAVNKKKFTVARASLGTGLYSAFAMVADSILVNVAGVSVPAGSEETKSLTAMRAYVEGHRALWKWEIDSAATAFQQAVDADTAFASANYWLAQSREWTQPMGSAFDWVIPAERAVRYADRLPRSERAMAIALGALAQQRYQVACDSLRVITRRDPRNFAALFALADCISRDNRIERDPRSPTGWRFRNSQGEAARAMSAALTAAPVPYRAFRARVFARLLRYSFTDMQMARVGTLVVGRDTQKFYAYPALDHDTVVYWPGSYEDYRRGTGGTKSETHAAAVKHNREVVRGVTREWANAYPRDPNALAAHAASLEALGDLVGATSIDTGAIDLLTRARRSDPPPPLATELAYNAVRVLTKAGRYADAARLGDSLLSATSSPTLPNLERLAGVAALLGRVELAASLIARTAEAYKVYLNGKEVTPTVLVARAALRANVYAAAEDADSSYAALARLDRELRSSTLPATYPLLRTTIHADPETYLFATNRPDRRIVADTSSPSWLVKLQRMYLANDRVGIARKVDSTLDATASLGVLLLDPRLPYHASKLLLQMGDTARAIRLLDVSIAALPTTSSQLLRITSDAMSIPQTLALRAEIAAARGDRTTARPLAQAALALWSRADARLAPRLTALRRIAAPSP